MKRLIALVFLVMVFLAVFPANASAAGGDAAKLDKVEVSAYPPQQGIGGEIEISATTHIYGGCCYHLYTYDAVATLEAPEEVQIISGPSPEVISEIDGPPGGIPQKDTFKWTIKSDVEGDFNLKIRVDTSNSGSVESEIRIKVTKGARISTPNLFPVIPEVGMDTHMEFEVVPTLPGVTLDQVDLYYAVFEKEQDVFEANGTQLVLENGDRIDGTKVDVEQDSFNPDLYKVKLSKEDEEGYLYYWITAIDSKGEQSTSAAYHAEILDPEGADNTKNVVLAVFMILFFFGSVVIILFHQRSVRKETRDSTRLFRLGSTGNTEFKDGPKSWSEQKPIVRYAPTMILIAFFVLVLIFAIIALVTGSFTEMITHLKEGK